MEKIFEIATDISTPLALAGFFAAAFLFIANVVLKKNIFPQLSRTLSADIIKTIINKLFYLALFAMFLGFAGYIFGMIYESPKTNSELKDMVISGTVRDSSNVPIRGVVVTIDGFNFKETTNRDGKFMDILKSANIGQIITLRTYHEKYKSFKDSKQVNSTDIKFNIILNLR